MLSAKPNIPPAPPLSQRVYSKARITSRQRITRDVCYNDWTYDRMGRAIQAETDKGKSIRRAAVEYNVPKSTLGDRVSGCIVHGATSGKPQYLSDEEEELLVRFLLKCASIGYPRSRKEVIGIVQNVCDKKGLIVEVTHGWWEGLCHRHPNISS